MLTVEQAQQKLISLVSPINAHEDIALNQCLGRILAQDITAGCDVPPHDNSAMDGIAVNSGALPQPPTTLPIHQRIAAGTAPLPLQAGSTARIFTGGELPDGADAVVMQENCEFLANDDSVTILKTVAPGENVRPKGQDIGQGDLVLQWGHRLAAEDIGLLASIGLAKVPVVRKLKLGILNTGDELVSPSSQTTNLLERGKIFNSNAPMLEALAQKCQCEVVLSQHVADTLDATKMALQESVTQCDLVITSGGVSVGDEDHIRTAIAELGSIDLWKIKLKPGKPLAFGHIQNTPILGLPGNPVSSFVTFLLFALPLIKTRQGSVYEKPLAFYLPCDFTIESPQSRPEYLRVRIENGTVHQYPNQSSGVLRSLSWANALALLPENTTIARGDALQVMPLHLML